MRCSNHSRRGFVLAEVIVVLVLSAVVVTALLAGLVALVRGLQPPVVAVGGETLAVAPTFGAFPAAVRVHETFTRRLADARAIYVFGGRHVSLPANADVATLKALKLQRLPVIDDFSAGLPLHAKQFFDTYAASLGDQETGGSPDDFSVVVIGESEGALAVRCFVQARRSEVSTWDGTTRTWFVRREVKLWDATEGQLRYAFTEKPATSNAFFVGAVHTWFRFGADASQQEEGPACVVFPDPWMYAGHRGGAGDIPAFSRFSYFLAVSP